jgi:gliding motility-associated transport system ATP-binding protein
VDGVSFTVASGDVAALLGPNGSGKSTVMRCLVGFFSPTRGRVLIDGQEVGSGAVSRRRDVGYLPENVVLYPDLRVRRYLGFVAGAKGLGGRAARRAVDDAIERCGLGEVAQRHTGKLSKGFRQRVGLAQAVLGDPKVLVLDEPTVGLDPVQTVEMRELIRRLEGCTVLLSTHLLAEASLVCRRIIILNRGRLVAEDTPAGLAQRLDRVGQVVVHVEGPSHEVESALAAVPGVTSAEPRDTAGREGVFVLRTADPERVQRQVASVVVGHGWTLLEIRVEAPTLEDLFVELVR